MNAVQVYSPPRLLALCLGGIIFVGYHLGRRPALMDASPFNPPVPLLFTIGFALILGYGLASLWWLIRSTKGQIWETFHPTRGRVIGAFCLAFVAPLVVVSWLPWLPGVLAVMVIFQGTWDSFSGIGMLLVGTLVAYPLSAMIVRHTYDQHLLRFGLFCLCFWSFYAGHLLWSGIAVLRIVY
ncbi:hypothetical protein [Octadecabacter ascidiaceicola]|nr:hypothetical protein [Octadecabacter ascidiaceicola]